MKRTGMKYYRLLAEEYKYISGSGIFKFKFIPGKIELSHLFQGKTLPGLQWTQPCSGVLFDD
jgi:hypothetical protein